MSQNGIKNKNDGTNRTHIPPQHPKNPDGTDRVVNISTDITTYEHDYLKAIASILSKLNLNGMKLIKDDSMSELIRGCLGSTCNMYQFNVFPDSSIASKLPDRESVKEFIAFRKKYMNFPIDAQLEDLKRLGLVKAKEAK